MPQQSNVTSILFLLLFLSCAYLKGQSNLDSLYAAWQNETYSDSIRTDAYISYINDGFLTSNPDSAFILAEDLLTFGLEKQSPQIEAKAYSLLGNSLYYTDDYPEAIDYHLQSLKFYEAHDNKKSIASASYNIGHNYYRLGDYAQALESYQRSLIIREEIADTTGISFSIASVGLAHYVLGNYQPALEYFQRSLTLREKLGDKKSIGESLTYIGLIYYVQSNYISAVEYFQRSLKIQEDIEDEAGIAYTLYVIGLIYFAQENYPKALDYYQRNLAMYEDIGDKRGITEALNSIGLVYSEQGNYPLALAYYQRSLKINEDIGDKHGIATSLNQIGLIYSEQGNYPVALKYHNRSLKLKRTSGEKFGISLSLSSIGLIYYNQGRYHDAIIACQESLANAKEMASIDLQKEAYSCLYKANKALGKINKSLQYLEQVTMLEDSLNVKETDKKLQQMEIEKQRLQDSVALERKEYIVKLAHQNEILELEAKTAKIRNQRNGIIGGMSLLAILGFIGYNFYKIRKDRNDKREFAEALIFAQENERRRIARDLHDGVGQSLLLIKKQLETTHNRTSENNVLINNTLEEVRSISRNLHPFQLEKLGLSAAINDVIEKIETSTDLFITREIEVIDGVFSKKNEIHYFRTIQEALNNVVKHADAGAAKITIEKIGNDIVTKIMDNGKGFEQEGKIMNSKTLGLRTMQERISTLGGQLKIESNAPSGTVVTFVIPKRAENG